MVFQNQKNVYIVKVIKHEVLTLHTIEKKIHVILHMEIAGSKYGECLMLCIWYLIHTHTTNTCCVPTF